MPKPEVLYKTIVKHDKRASFENKPRILQLCELRLSITGEVFIYNLGCSGKNDEREEDRENMLHMG